MKRTMIMFLILSLVTGTFLVMMSNHWFPMWLGLELSTLSMIPILKTKMKPRSKEATMKYFLVQAFSAAMLLKGAMMKLWQSKTWKIKETLSTTCYMIMLSALIMKLGLAPFHFWFPDVLSGIPFSKGMIMACWQKMAPLYLLLLTSKKIPKEMMLTCATTSVLMGGWGGLNQTSLRKMLAYSSMSHLGWMSATLFFSQEMALLMFLFYMLKKTAMFLMCHKKNLYSLSKLKKTKTTPSTTILFSTLMLSMGGLPPLGGFLKKLIPLKMFLKKMKMMFMLVFIFGSLTSLYFYLRMVFKTSLTLFPKKSLMMLLKNPQSTKKTTKLMISITLPLSMWGITLTPMFWLFM